MIRHFDPDSCDGTVEQRHRNKALKKIVEKVKLLRLVSTNYSLEGTEIKRANEFAEKVEKETFSNHKGSVEKYQISITEQLILFDQQFETAGYKGASQVARFITKIQSLMRKRIQQKEYRKKRLRARSLFSTDAKKQNALKIKTIVNLQRKFRQEKLDEIPKEKLEKAANFLIGRKLAAIFQNWSRYTKGCKGFRFLLQKVMKKWYDYQLRVPLHCWYFTVRREYHLSKLITKDGLRCELLIETEGSNAGYIAPNEVFNAIYLEASTASKRSITILNRNNAVHNETSSYHLPQISPKGKRLGLGTSKIFDNVEWYLPKKASRPVDYSTSDKRIFRALSEGIPVQEYAESPRTMCLDSLRKMKAMRRRH